MNRLFLAIVAAAGLVAGWTAAPGVAGAQVMVTPAGCNWADVGERRQVLWCRDAATGRMAPTATVRRDEGDAVASCPRGMLDAGLGCVREADALDQAAAMGGGTYQPQAWNPGAAPPPRRSTRPEIYLLGGRYGYSDGDYRQALIVAPLGADGCRRGRDADGYCRR